MAGSGSERGWWGGKVQKAPLHGPRGQPTANFSGCPPVPPPRPTAGEEGKPDIIARWRDQHRVETSGGGPAPVVGGCRPVAARTLLQVPLGGRPVGRRDG